MDQEMLSIVVPVYNLKNELPRCLDSILAQTYRQLEVIVVDDGSTDGSADVIRSYAERDARIKPVFQPNGGVTSARLHGARKASGEWIGFVDGDDEIEADMYERLLNNAAAYHAQISHCGYQMHFPDGRVHYFHNTGCIEKQDKITALKELLSGSRVEPGLCNKLFHKRLLQSLFRSDAVPTDIRINEDLLMNYRLFSAAEQTVYEDWCPYHYIVRSTSASRTKLDEHKIYDPIRVKEMIRKSVPMELYEDAQRAYLNTCLNTYNTLLGVENEHHADLSRVRSLLTHESDSFFLLGKKREAMAKMILRLPGAYKTIYTVYSRYFQKNIYK